MQKKLPRQKHHCMNIEIKKYLYDIHQSILSIHEYMQNAENFKDYTENKMLKRAVEREFEIIGEALNNILKMDKNLSITHARKIVDFRNMLIHGYAFVSDKVVWSVIHKDLGVLKTEVTNLLK